VNHVEILGVREGMDDLAVDARHAGERRRGTAQ